MKSWYKRYTEGRVKEVWHEIDATGIGVFHKTLKEDALAVLKETMLRVGENLDLIYIRLLEINYEFEDKVGARKRPVANVEELINKLISVTESFGYPPLSILEFYRTVGSVDFRWSFNKTTKIFTYADPILVSELGPEVEYMAPKHGDWYKVMQARKSKEQPGFIDISPDYFAKDNEKGGEPYSLELTEDPMLDSNLLFEHHQTTFVGYLRHCMEWAGFPLIEKYNSNYEKFISSLKKDLKKI